MRLERRRFVEELEHGGSLFPQLIFSRSTGQGTVGERPNVITVVFDLDWPRDERPVRTTPSSLPRTAVAGTLFRVKDYLERRIMSPVQLLDVRAGCIRVRYELVRSVDVGVVQNAVQALVAERRFFNVLSVSGNVRGRAIKV